MFDDQPLQCVHVRHQGADQIVGVSRHQIALHDFRQDGDFALEDVQGGLALLVQRDLDEHVDFQPQFARVQQRDAAIDQALGFQAANTSQAGRG
ncbi:hypothetical protein D3C81_1984280 [compost metagenome]